MILKSWLKIILFSILGLALASSLVFSGFKLGERKSGSLTPTPKSTCGSCPRLGPFNPDFCKDGVIISGEKDDCGCQLPPRCQRAPKDWKIYTSTKYGYEIRYPNNWVLEFDKQAPQEIVSFTHNFNSLAIYSGSSRVGEPPGIFPVSKGFFELCGKKVKRQEYAGLFEVIAFPVLIIEPEKGVNSIVVRHREGVYNQEYGDIFNLMLSTFKCLD